MVIGSSASASPSRARPALGSGGKGIHSLTYNPRPWDIRVHVLQINLDVEMSPLSTRAPRKKDLGKMEFVWGSLFALTGSAAQDDEIV